MTKRFYLALLCASLALPGAAHARDRLDVIAKRGVLSACLGLESPPYAFIDEHGKPAGLTYDQAAALHKAVEREVGKPLEFKLVRSTPVNRVEFIKQGRCDFMILMQNEGRARDLDYTEEKIHSTGGVLVAPKTLQLESWEDLRGRTVCAPLVSSWVKPFERDYGVKFASFYNPAEVLRAVADGRCVGQLTSDTVWVRMEREQEVWKDFEIKFPPKYFFFTGVALRRGEARLKDVFERALAEWHRSGFIQQLEDKYDVPHNEWALARHRQVLRESAGASSEHAAAASHSLTSP